MKLPDLKYDYSHSVISSVQVGPRREVTLSIQALEWWGYSGQLSPAKSIKFGGIVNFDEVAAFFAQHQSLELACLRYSPEYTSKQNNLFIELYAERTDDKLTIQCSSLQVG